MSGRDGLIIYTVYWCLLMLGVVSAVLTGHNLRVAEQGGGARTRRGLVARLIARFGDRPPRMRIPIGVAAAAIPAHNEEAVIATTLRSVLAAFHREDVFIFCDNCDDATETIARRYLPAENIVVGTRPLGKSRGIERLLTHLILPCGYRYVTVIDADTTIEPDFLVQSLKALRYTDVACVVGQVRSRWYPKSVFTVYRSVVYLFWLTLMRELQNATGAILVASGCATTWKTRVLAQIPLDHRLIAEDVDLTMQVHRRGLGKVVYARSAVVWTQDPADFGSYRRQTQRWVRAFWEAMRKHRVGLRPLRRNGQGRLRPSPPDLLLALLVLDSGVLLANLFLPPLFLIHPVHWQVWRWAIGSRLDALIMLLYYAVAMLLAAGAAALALGSLRAFLYSPIFLAVLYFEVVHHVAGMISALRRPYLRPSIASEPGGTTWASPSRREV